MTLNEFIKNHVAKIEPLEYAGRLAWWNLAVTADEIYERQIQEANIALRKIYSSKEDYDFLMGEETPSDSLLARQKKILLNDYIENQIDQEMIEKAVKLETEVETIYTKFRAKIGTETYSNNDLKDILLNSHEPSRRQAAWEASKLIGEQVEEKVLELVELRNASAKKAGFDNYYTMRLTLQELDEVQLFNLLAQVDELTRPHWKTYKSSLDEELSSQHGIGPAELKPWHYQDPFFQEAPQQGESLNEIYKGVDIAETSRLFFGKIGLDVDDILERSDLYERDNKNQHAFCTCIDRKQDCRILCNLRDDEYWMGTQLHELGHAVYDKYIDQDLPFLLRSYAHISTTESIAMLFGRLSKNGEFLKEYCQLNSEKARHIDKSAQAQLSANLLVFVRWVLVMTHFERALYQGSTKNLNQLWWDYVEQFQEVKRIPLRDKPDWAAKLHLACAPVYYQNYLLGEMTASQIKHALETSLKSKPEDLYGSVEIGNFLKEKLFSFGARFPWNETLRLATGEELKAKYFLRDIALSRLQEIKT